MNINTLIDQVALDCKKNISFDEVIKYLKSKVPIFTNCSRQHDSKVTTFKKSKLESNYVIARLVFRWIADNISYDVKAWLANDFTNATDIDHIFKTKMTFCAGYATLFEKMCVDCGMDPKDVVYICGTSKGAKKKGEKIENTKSNHAWNAVKMECGWQLIDTTWASGQLFKRQQFCKKFSEFWFCSPPDQFVFSHIPDEKEWLLFDGEFTLEQWYRAPKVTDYFFRHEIGFIDEASSPGIERIEIKERFHCFSLVITDDTIIILNLLDGNDRCYHDKTCVTSEPSEGDMKGRLVILSCDFSDLSGHCKLNVFAGKINAKKKHIFTYKLNVDLPVEEEIDDLETWPVDCVGHMDIIEPDEVAINTEPSKGFSFSEPSDEFNFTETIDFNFTGIKKDVPE